jgi:hypothetical protein
MRSTYRWVGVSLLLAVPACYKSVPLETSTPPVGETVSFIISDQGRVELSDRVGPGILRIEGRMIGTEGEQYVINVFRTAAIGGSTSLWSGEEMRLNRNLVSRLEGRQLSKSRTWLAAGAATSVVIAFIVTRGLTGLFGGDESPPREEEPPQSSRGRPGIRP